jgi:dTDP-glucose 4,6-dehydratase
MTRGRRRLLLTGGAGFIGSHVLRQGLASDAFERIVVLDLLTYAGSTDNIADCLGRSEVEFIKGDIADQALVGRILADHQITDVVHAAAETHVDRSIYGPMSFVQTNVVGTALLLESVRHYLAHKRVSERPFRFLLVSTDEVYGSIETGAFSENDPYRPSSPYSASKAGADHLARAWHVTYGLPVIITHCSNNFGPYQYPEKLIPRMIGCLMTHQPMPLYGGGEQVRDWIYVEDHAAFLLFALEKAQDGAVLNIGGEYECSNRQLLENVVKVYCELTGGNPLELGQLIQDSPDRPGHDKRYALDNTRARAMGWKRRTPFDKALRRTVQWYLDNPAWLEGRCS